MRRLATIITLITLATPASASAEEGVLDGPYQPYEPGRQSWTALGLGAAGGGVGFVVGAGVGVGAFIVLGGANHVSPPWATGALLASLVGGTLTGSMIGATTGATWAGDPTASERVEASMWTGAWGGSAVGALGAIGLFVLSINTGYINAGAHALPVTVGSGALLMGAGAGIGAALGYQLELEKPTVDDFVLTPTLGPDRAGVALGFTF
jgi:hypothetical protein